MSVSRSSTASMAITWRRAAIRSRSRCPCAARARISTRGRRDHGWRPRACQPRTRKILLLVHGLCMSDAQWTHEGYSHGTALADAFGYTPIYLRYNSGRHIADNGRDLAEPARATAAALAGGGRRPHHPGSQHGRPGRTQRLPARTDVGPALAAAPASHGFSGNATPWFTAGARRPRPGLRARPESLLRADRAHRQVPQRRHQGPAPRHDHRGQPIRTSDCPRGFIATP